MVTDGIEQLVTFTGQAFEIPPHATLLLSFNEKYQILLHDTAWKFYAHTKRISVKNFSQAALLEHGKGRIVVFGEAAMLTAQIKGKDRISFGLTAKEASHNLHFLLNIIH